MPGGTVTILVQDVKSQGPLPEYKFIINENNVGDPQVNIPIPDRNPNLYPSLKPAASHSPVVAVGEVRPGDPPAAVYLDDGSYLISIVAPQYKMGGNWVKINGSDVIVSIELYPNPLPLSMIRVHVFHDNNSVNGEDDVPLELGLPGFFIQIEDAIGQVTVDYFNHPLGTQYETDQQGNLILVQGQPIPIPGTGGVIISDATGDAVIENLPPGKYGVQAIPPDGSDWIQTTTIEGTHIIDAWIEEGNDGYSPREGFKGALVWIGFVTPMSLPTAPGTATIKGRVFTVIEFVPPFRPLFIGDPVVNPWIALNNISGNDEQVYTGQGYPDGTFIINNVPPGTYQLVLWDEPMDYIISFRTVIIVNGQ